MDIKIHLTFYAFIICLFFASSTINADEKIILKSDAEAKIIFLGHYWKCNWKDKNYTWNSERMYKKVSLKRVTAKIRNDVCPDGLAKFRGSLKGGNISGRFSNYPAPCGSGSIVSDGYLFTTADGSYYTKSNYIYGSGIDSNDPVMSERTPQTKTHGVVVCTATPR